MVVNKEIKTAAGKVSNSARVAINKIVRRTLAVDSKAVAGNKAIKIAADKTVEDSKVDNNARAATNKTGSKGLRKTGKVEDSKVDNRASNKITVIKNNKVLNTTSVF